jgi:glycosyltransferase involved in cell wall biosynthesis
MKVAFLIPPGDPEEKPNLRALREADALKQAGHEVEMQNLSMLHWAYMSTIPPMGKFFKRIRHHNQSSRALALWAVTGKPDLIICHDVYTLTAGARAARKLGVPLLYDSHEDFPALIGENSRVESILANIIERRAPIAHVFAPCEPIAARFRRRGIPATVLYNARASKDVVKFGREFARAKFGFAEDDFVVGYVGALEQLTKGGMGLLFLAALKAFPDNVKALIVGGPDDVSERLRVAVADLGLSRRVTVLPQTPFGELPEVYAALDVGLILLDARPNYMVSLPNKLFDYMAFGVPVIAPDYPEMADIIDAEGCGVLLNGWADPEVQYAVLKGVLSVAQERRTSLYEMGQRGRAAFVERYAWEHHWSGEFVRICEEAVRFYSPFALQPHEFWPGAGEPSK